MHQNNQNIVLKNNINNFNNFHILARILSDCIHIHHLQLMHRPYKNNNKVYHQFSRYIKNFKYKIKHFCALLIQKAKQNYYTYKLHQNLRYREAIIKRDKNL